MLHLFRLQVYPSILTPKGIRFANLSLWEGIITTIVEEFQDFREEWWFSCCCAGGENNTNSLTQESNNNN